ncbi:Desumoylating isopeptidase 2 [Symbiodinium microadriaticum]|uniref:Desumoylating isopeptidase 2 n=1 Tax=Symbiodinium microadriaticum TaxID=2951 RepID=A0A1Q9CI16_SYMMI|nr:Desumoylating isopeptidase 2 [Symbiodinium microadriaticum]
MRAAPARAAPGGRRGSVPGDLLNIESLPLREVLVNIYEAEGRKQPIIRSRLNLRAILAGASHAGVEVYRREYGYAFTEEEVSGISECVPRRRKNFLYRVTLEMGLCPLSEGRVQELLTDMAPTWRGSEFNAIHNNSLDFADAFLQQLGVGRLPRELGESGASSPGYISSCNAKIFRPLQQTCSMDFSLSGLFRGAAEMGYSVAAMLAQPFSQEEADGEDPEVQAHSADRQLFCQSVACTDDDAGLLATEPANSSLDAEYFVGDVEPLPDSSDTLHELEITVARGLAQDRQLGCLLSARDTEKAARGSEEKSPVASTQQRVEEPRVLHRSWRHLPSVGTWHAPRLKDARQLLPSVGT